MGPLPLRIAHIGCDVVRRTIVAGPRPHIPTAPRWRGGGAGVGAFPLRSSALYFRAQCIQTVPESTVTREGAGILSTEDQHEAGHAWVGEQAAGRPTMGARAQEGPAARRRDQ